MAASIVLVDIGSTFTKVVAVDLEQKTLVGKASAPTTSADVSLGLEEALEGLKLSRAERAGARVLASSSAAGGLKMVAIGLVEDLTAKAARLAALGAGARVLRTYSFQLTEADQQEIAQLRPDIILLAGGTDGGNTENILHNAAMLAALPGGAPILIAGNRSVAAEAAALFPENFSTYVAPNVMPQIGRLQVEPAREAIRQVFMEKIIFAKGLSKASRLIEGIFMPTPAAVLRAGRLLSEGVDAEQGWGDLLIIDVGGATTDVHSLGTGLPTKAGVVARGLPEPFAKRTVEGDLGVRVSVVSLLEAVTPAVLAEATGWSAEQVLARVNQLASNPETLPLNATEAAFDSALGYQAVNLAVARHVGRLSELFTPSGRIWIQDGKDLAAVRRVIGTGGVLINAERVRPMLAGTESRAETALELRPENPRYFVDGDYILAAMGLLAVEHPRVALEILKCSIGSNELAKGDR